MSLDDKGQFRAQKTQLMSGPVLAHNQTVFPSLLFSARAPEVVSGDGVSAGVAGTGVLRDTVNNAIYTGASLTEFVVRYGDFFGVVSPQATLNLVSGNMPEIGDLYPLLIVVRTATDHSGLRTAIGDPEISTGLTIGVGLADIDASSALIGITPTNNVTLSGWNFNAAYRGVVCAAATFLDRDKATDILAAQIIFALSNGIFLSTDTRTDVGTATDLIEATFPRFTTGLKLCGHAATPETWDNNYYGIYLLGFTTNFQLQPAWLTPQLQWMARNPKKGLPRTLVGML